MSKKKIMPQTLLSLKDIPLMQKIMDKSEYLVDTIETVKKFWSFDLYSRSPSLIMENEEVVATNLDMASLVYTLAERSANIKISEYKSLRPKTIKPKKTIEESKKEITGKIVSISSNKDIFSFSFKLFNEDTKEYKNFCITDPNGELYLKSFDFKMTEEEENFLEKNQMKFSDQIRFKYFVHPNRWTSFYGAKYFITKALIDRIADECKNYFIQIKRMQTNGIKYPETNTKTSESYKKKEKEKGKSIKFKSLEVEVDYPSFNEYKLYDDTQENLVELTLLRKYNLYKVLPILRFATRCTEFAFFKYGEKKFPSWIGGGAKWETGYKLPRKKIEWDRFKIIQKNPGQFSIAIRKRIREKSEIMAMDYKE